MIGIPHWEYEFQHYPRWGSRHFARQLINSIGFDLLVGSHPHTLFPMDAFQNGLCFYSLGNLVGQGIAWQVKLISILEVKLVTDPCIQGPDAITQNGHSGILGYQLHFFVQSHHKDGSIHIIPLEDTPIKTRNRMQQHICRIYRP